MNGKLTAAELKELDEIQSANPDGMLLAEDVAKYVTKNKKSALRSRFTLEIRDGWWQNMINEARAVIRLRVFIIESPAEPKKLNVKLRAAPVPAYVHLSSDAEGGYRRIEDVLKDEVQRKCLLDDAMRDLAAFRNRYERLSKVAEILEPVMKTIDSALTKHETSRGRAA